MKNVVIKEQPFSLAVKMNFGMWQHLRRLIIQTLVGLVEGSVG